ncbi:glycosyltransferase [Paucibacter sp. AS339]|uniref:glycosyltransferase n=1 Tax=Paucibacter hankyongi TaxID=3133434 RepID=UPI0030A55B83
MNSLAHTPRITISTTAAADNSLLLELPVPFKRIAGVLHVEAQAHNGIARWLDNFDRLSLCAPLLPEAGDALLETSTSWLPVADLLQDGRLSLHTLPWGYHPLTHYQQRASVAALFERLIPQHRYLCFANLGWLGSWGNIAADLARAKGRDYAVWLDWVLHEMPPAEPGGLMRRAFGRLKLAMLKRNSLRAVRHATLGLFHGRSVQQAYAPFCLNPQLVHNIHLKRHDIIGEPALQQRLARDDGILRIGYAGRLHAMKGPLQWLSAVAGAIGRAKPGQRIQACWIGDGPMLEEARQWVRAHGLEGQIRFPGAVNDRAKVLEFLRSLDLFVFCHLTPESPRCLIEALMSGLPLLGYASPYAQDLVAARKGAGRFVDIGDSVALSHLLSQQLERPALRQTMARDAWACGQEFSDEAVFKHRSDLIKAHL